MCLAVPGKLIQIRNEDGSTAMGRVDFGGVVKEVCLSYLPEAKVGDYVMTHAGFAISRVEEAEARQVFEMLAEIDELMETPGGEEGGDPGPTRPSEASGPRERAEPRGAGDARPEVNARGFEQAGETARPDGSDALR